MCREERGEVASASAAVTVMNYARSLERCADDDVQQLGDYPYLEFDHS